MLTWRITSWQKISAKLRDEILDFGSPSAPIQAVITWFWNLLPTIAGHRRLRSMLWSPSHIKLPQLLKIQKDILSTGRVINKMFSYNKMRLSTLTIATRNIYLEHQKQERKLLIYRTLLPLELKIYIFYYFYWAFYTTIHKLTLSLSWQQKELVFHTKWRRTHFDPNLW